MEIELELFSTCFFYYYYLVHSIEIDTVINSKQLYLYLKLKIIKILKRDKSDSIFYVEMETFHVQEQWTDKN